jgi:cell wall-associated NlpC family hydrolase
MSVAARIARLAMAVTMCATAMLSIAAAGSPVTVLAAQAKSVPTTSSADKSTNQRALIVRIAKSHVGAQYRFGAEGPTKYFDCSGLVFAVYKQAGLADKISGVRRGAKGYLKWFRDRGLASKHNPKPGDLVIWNNGHHIGIYVGNGMAVSALNRRYGVREHPIGFVHTFTTYLHVQIRGTVPAPTTGGSGSGAGSGNTGGSTGNTGGGGGGNPTPVTVETTVDQLIARDGPGDGHQRVAVLDRGTLIQATGKATDGRGRIWVVGKLRNGRVVWVRARFVRIV